MVVYKRKTAKKNVRRRNFSKKGRKLVCAKRSYKSQRGGMVPGNVNNMAGDTTYTLMRVELLQGNAAPAFAEGTGDMQSHAKLIQYFNWKVGDEQMNIPPEKVEELQKAIIKPPEIYPDTHANPTLVGQVVQNHVANRQKKYLGKVGPETEKALEAQRQSNKTTFVLNELQSLDPEISANASQDEVVERALTHAPESYQQSLREIFNQLLNTQLQNLPKAISEAMTNIKDLACTQAKVAATGTSSTFGKVQTTIGECARAGKAMISEATLKQLIATIFSAVGFMLSDSSIVFNYATYAAQSTIECIISIVYTLLSNLYSMVAPERIYDVIIEIFNIVYVYNPIYGAVVLALLCSSGGAAIKRFRDALKDAGDTFRYLKERFDNILVDERGASGANAEAAMTDAIRDYHTAAEHNNAATKANALCTIYLYRFISKGLDPMRNLMRLNIGEVYREIAEVLGDPIPTVESADEEVNKVIRFDQGLADAAADAATAAADAAAAAMDTENTGFSGGGRRRVSKKKLRKRRKRNSKSRKSKSRKRFTKKH